jgi:TolA-binding protein
MKSKIHEHLTFWLNRVSKKTAIVLFLPLLGLVACNTNSRSSENTSMVDSVSIRDSLDRLRDRTRVEIEEYRTRIRARIDEMQRDIDAVRERWKAERNAKKQREYQEDLERREKKRSTLQQKLDRMGDHMEEEWQEFKHEVDEFFDNDRNTESNK